MLVEKKKYSEGDVVSFKIANGDEVIARVESDTEDAYMVTKPMTVVPSSNGLGLMQSLFSVKTDLPVSLSKKHVMLHSPTMGQMADHYREVTTGIQTVRKGSIIV